MLEALQALQEGEIVLTAIRMGLSVNVPEGSMVHLTFRRIPCAICPCESKHPAFPTFYWNDQGMERTCTVRYTLDGVRSWCGLRYVTGLELPTGVSAQEVLQQGVREV